MEAVRRQRSARSFGKYLRCSCIMQIQVVNWVHQLTWADQEADEVAPCVPAVGSLDFSLLGLPGPLCAQEPHPVSPEGLWP